MNLTGCVLVGIVLLSSPTIGRSQTKHLPIIDVHMHCYADDERWKTRVPNPITGRPMTATTEQALLRGTLAEMGRYNVVRGMVSGDYDAALRWDRAAPGRFIIGYAFEDPAKVDIDFLRREYVAGRLKAIGEVGAQYEGIAPNDPRLEPIFALAEELDIPVAITFIRGRPEASTKVLRACGKASAILCCLRTCWFVIPSCGST